MGKNSFEIEVFYEVTSYHKAIEAKTNALPEDCYPGEGEEIEFDLFAENEKGEMIKLTDQVLYDSLADKILDAERDREDAERDYYEDLKFEARRDEGR
jgi:hypothetical protein